MKIAILLTLTAAFVMLLLEGQRRVIYYPRPYGADLALPANCRAVPFTTGQGEQQAFYLWFSGSGEMLPERLWLVGGGNASLALDWLEIFAEYPDPGAGFLLLDYPGYGRSRGRATPETILESIEAALAALAGELGANPGELGKRLSVMGHSLGAAAVLMYAGGHPVNRLVLVSPFTSLRDMAALVVGRPLNRTLLHNYDNRARLGEVFAASPGVPVTIIHGSHDKVVPVAMGRELARLFPAIDYREIDRGDHNYILVTAREEVFAAMTGPEAAGQPGS